jgi:Tol biopolymer transport system component
MPPEIAESDSARAGPGRIAFASWRSGRSDLFTMGTRGRAVHRITHDSYRDLSPSWSRDGKWLAFRKEVDGDYEIFKVQWDGNREIQLTHNAWHDGGPQFSPNGRKIVFHSDRSGNGEIYIMRANGNSPRRVTRHPGKDWGPSWCASGWIVYSSGRDLFKTRPGELQRFPLTHSAPHDVDPDCSPAGTRILFTQGGFTDRAELMVIGIDGSNKRRITFNDVRDGAAHWAPSGPRLVFASQRDGDLDIYRMRLDRSHRRKLTYNDVPDQAPSWQRLPPT